MSLLAIIAGDIYDWNMNLNILASSLLYIGLFLLCFSFFIFSCKMFIDKRS